MPKQLFFIVVFVLFILSCSTTDTVLSAGDPAILSGTWEGKLSVGVVQLRLVFNFKIQEGTLLCTMDSPDQGAFGIPVSEVIAGDGADVTLVVSVAAARFEGKLVARDQITGTWFQGNLELPLELSKHGTPIDYSRPQDPKEPFPYQAVEVTFQNVPAGINLAGTFTFPKTEKPVPAVILISGSGSQNRNEEIMGHRPFLVLADHLTRRGIAVLRYDDRGVGGSGGNPGTATSADYATDAEAASQFLKTQNFVKISKIGLIGHSEGGIIAPLAADKSKDVGFIVLLAGPGFGGMEILLQQSEAIMRAMGASEQDIRQAMERNGEIYDILLGDDNMETKKSKIRELARQAGIAENQIDAQVVELTSPWFLFFLEYDPLPVLERTRIPVLALNGSLDLQVLPKENLAAIQKALQKAGNTRYTIKEFPGLNHLFQTAKTGLMDEYSAIQETIAPAVLEFIGDWINGLE